MPVTLTGGGFKKEKVFVEFLSLASLMVKDIEILRQAKESGAVPSMNFAGSLLILLPVS